MVLLKSLWIKLHKGTLSLKFVFLHFEDLDRLENRDLHKDRQINT